MVRGYCVAYAVVLAEKNLPRRFLPGRLLEALPEQNHDPMSRILTAMQPT
jgi:hypothetical protein